MNGKEKLKISIARTLLEFSDRLLGRNPDSFDTFLSAKAKEEQDKQFAEIKAVDEEWLDDIDDQEAERDYLNQRDIDYDFSSPDDCSDEMIIFQAELEALIVKHIGFTSGLVIAGPLVAEALKLYRTILPQDEYDQIVSHIYQTRNNIQKTTLPQDVIGKTLH